MALIDWGMDGTDRSCPLRPPNSMAEASHEKQAYLLVRSSADPKYGSFIIKPISITSLQWLFMS